MRTALLLLLLPLPVPVDRGSAEGGKMVVTELTGNEATISLISLRITPTTTPVSMATESCDPSLEVDPAGNGSAFERPFH